MHVPIPATSHIYAYSQNTQPANTQTYSNASANASQQMQHQQPSRWGYMFSPRTGEFHSLSAALVTIGRSENCSIMIPDDKISGVHCVITREANPHFNASGHAGSDFFSATPSFGPSDTFCANFSLHHNGGSNNSPFVFLIEDRSMNGTFVNDVRLKKNVKERLESGQEISFVALSSKRSRTSDSRSPSSSTLPPKTTSYLATFDFQIDRDQRTGTRVHSAMSEASFSTAMATPASMAFPADPNNPYGNNAASGNNSKPTSAGVASDFHLRNADDNPLQPLGLGANACGMRGANPLNNANNTSAALSRHHSARPKVLSWQWGECVGSGSFADVFIGIDTETARMIAIKRIKQSIYGEDPTIDELNDGYSDTLKDWGVDPNDVFDPSKNSQGGGGDDGTRVLQRCDSSTDNILDAITNTKASSRKANNASSSSGPASPHVLAQHQHGCSPTDPTASTLPMISKAVLRREYSCREEYQGLSSEQHAEVELLKSLSHPSVVHYYGFAIEDNHLCILLEFVAGGSLVALLKKFGALQESVVRIYTTQALQGLEYLHENNVVHGDIKPGNFLVSDKGRVKLSDFGTGRIVSSAKQRGGGVGGRGSLNDSLTINDTPNNSGGGGGGELARGDSAAPAQLTGTPAFMSPEMVKGGKSTFASDVWALGCTVLELFTGKMPWAELGLEGNVFALIYQIGTRFEAPSLQYVREKNASEALVNFLQWCFTISPTERPTATDLLTHPFISPDSQCTLATWQPPSLLLSGAAACGGLQSLMHSQNANGFTPIRGINGPSSNGALLSSSPLGGVALFNEHSSNAIHIPPPPISQQPQRQAAAGHNSQQSQQQESQQKQEREILKQTSEMIDQHQQFLHSLARKALKRVPTRHSPPPPASATTITPSQLSGASVIAADQQHQQQYSQQQQQHATSAPSLSGLGKAVAVSAPFPSLPNNLFKPDAAVLSMGLQTDSEYINSGTAPCGPPHQHAAADDDEGRDAQRRVAGTSMKSARAHDHEEVSGGRHSGLTTKLRRIELDWNRDDAGDDE